MTVAIAGIGGIGSNVAAHLVRSGMESLMIADFDVVELSNLNRQFYFRDQLGMKKTDALENNLLRIRDDLKIRKIERKIRFPRDGALFDEFSVVVEGLDRAEDKVDLIDCLLKKGKTVISANGIAGFETSSVKVENTGKLWIVGDFVSEAGDMPLFSHKVQIVAAEMAALALKEGGFLV